MNVSPLYWFATVAKPFGFAPDSLRVG
jgi:hypothetical protein